ncbi:MAG: DctP family TRAP transporter solute-binding subunit [Arenicella sp.]
MKTFCKKPFRLFKSPLLFLLIVAIVSPLGAYAEPIVIRFSHVVAEDTPKGLLALKFQELVQQRLGDDKVVVKIFPNSSLFGDSSIGDEILKGNVELAAPNTAKLKKYTKRLQVFDIPFLFVSPEAASKFLSGTYGKRMLRLVDSKGLIGLGFLNNGMKQLSANKKIVMPEDVAGMKFRIVNSDVMVDQFNTLDAVPIKKSFKALYGALETGELDGQQNTWSNIYSKKFHEHQPYILESNHAYLGYMLLSSQKFWKSMPDDIRGIVEQALSEALDYGNEIAVKKAEEDRRNIVESGMVKLHTMSLDERKAWTKALQPVWKTYEDEIGSDLINAAASSR